jgi:hypothetical protein
MHVSYVFGNPYPSGIWLTIPLCVAAELAMADVGAAPAAVVMPITAVAAAEEIAAAEVSSFIVGAGAGAEVDSSGSSSDAVSVDTAPGIVVTEVTVPVTMEVERALEV